MVKSIVVSLLLGAAAVIAGLLLYFFAALPDLSTSPLILDGTAAHVEVGEVLPGRGTQLLTDDRGLGVVQWAIPDTQAGSYPYLRVQLQGSKPASSLSVVWKTAVTGESLKGFRVPDNTWPIAWVLLTRSKEWRGAISEFGIVIQGEPQQAVQLERVELLPDTAATRLRMIRAQWLTSSPWDHRSINLYPGTRYLDAMAPLPLPVFAIWLALSLLFYVVLRRGVTGLSWEVVAGIFLACWITLDLMWQGKFLVQLRETQVLYAGKSSEAKRKASPDAALFEFVAEASELMTSARSRVFVASSDDYTGMRGAYYALPHNVYWERGGRELPPRQAIQADDYILVLPPAALNYNSHENFLETRDGDVIPVQLLIARQAGALFRVL
tara:strand:- start:36956 stop:38101 length:1146 start_codon:yes stop_codon:yes gene_type:complete